LFTNTLEPEAHPYFHHIAGLRVSAHVLIRRDGELTQYVPFRRRAWHAGESNWMGRSTCNDYSIGVELEGTDECPYEDVQYERLGALVRLLREVWPGITPERVVGHCEVAPQRKTDPGPCFDWARLRRLII
jgi:N-acetyl-anhydromuramoyl-L-alanine amidase